jgi:serine/threonine-protein kinase
MGEISLKIGDSEVDFKGLLIVGPAGRHSMEPKIMDLLRVLTQNAGEVMTREELITAVWGVEYGGDERLSRAISLLRKALGDTRGHHSHIVTISRVGYRLIAQTRLSDDKPAIVAAQPQALKPPLPIAPRREAEDLPVSERSEPAANLLPSSSTPPNVNPQHKSSDQAASIPRAAGGSYGGLRRGALFVAGLLVCFAAGIFYLSGGTGTGSESLSRRAKMEQGYSHIANFTPKGAIAQAQDIFGDILAEDMDHAGARAGLAFALFREYTHLERDPALLQRGKAHAQAALRADEHLALANIAAAWAAEFEGDFDRAHLYMDRADVLDGENVLSLEGRYRSLAKEGHPQRAAEILNTAINAHPDYALFYAYRGSSHIRSGDFAASEQDFRKAIELSPDNARTYAELAHSLHLQGRTDEAIGVIQQGLAIHETTLLYNNLGTYLFFQGQFDLAASAFEETVALSGDTHSYLYWANLGDAYRWSREKENEATTAYRRALQLLQVDLDRYPNDDNHKSRAAMFNAKLGNLDEARRFMDSFTLGESAPAIQYYRAVVTYEILSDRRKALSALEATLKANYPLIEILNDPELSRLRQDPDYHRLLAKTKHK